MIRKLALIALALLLAYPANAACAGNCFYAGNNGNFGGDVIVDDAGLPYLYDAFGTSGLSIAQTVGVTSKATASAYCAAKVGTGSYEIWGAPYGGYVSNFSNNPPILASAYEVSNCGAGDWGCSKNFGNQSGAYMFIRCAPPTGGETILGKTTFDHWLLTSPYYSSNFSLYSPPPPIADFNGTPLNGTAPLTVQLLDNSSYGPFTSYSWSGTGPGTLYFDTPTAANTGLYLTVAGTYTITHGVSNAYFSDFETKTDYIQVYNSTSMKTKYFQTIDGTNGNIVLNSSIQLEDIENASWTNATGLINDGMSSITTLTGHHINAYAQALGYSDSDDLNILNDGQPQYIMMWPTFAKNVSEGNVSLYVTVKDKDTKANIAGAGVTISPSVGSAQSTTTNAAGIAYFIVTNNTAVLVTAQAIGQGYQTATTTINTGTGSGGSAAAAATILLGKNTVTPTFPTVTTLPGGGTPTPTITILPGCEDQTSPEGQAKCRKAQSNQGLSFLSAHMLDLIMICVFVTIMYLLGFKLGK